MALPARSINGTGSWIPGRAGNDRTIRDSLKNRASLVEREARVSREQQAGVAVTQVEDEVGLEASIGKKLGVHLGQINPAHRAAVQAERACRDHEIGAAQGAIARGGGR